MDQTLKPDRPWIVIGTGPTFQAPDPKRFRIIALNRAANHVDAEVIAISHRTTLEKIPLARFKGKTVIVGDPFIVDPGLEPVRQYKPVMDLAKICKLKVYKRYDHSPVSVEALKDGLPQYGTIATFAIAWLRYVGAVEFYSAGIDGGNKWHPQLAGDYRGLSERFSTNYDHAMNCIVEVVKALGMQWHRLKAEGEA